MIIQTIDKIKKSCHTPMNYEAYNSTNTRNETNCFSHAIGSTVTNNRLLYRLGMISEKKPVDQEYFSMSEVKELFLSDIKVLELNIEELPFTSKDSFLKDISRMNLNENEYIIVLFVKIYADKKIRDFHFIRYDREMGWTEKFFGVNFFKFDNIKRDWPPESTRKVVGAFKVKR